MGFGSYVTRGPAFKREKEAWEADRLHTLFVRVHSNYI